MDVLFLHAHVPGHYEHLAPALAADPGNRVVFGTAAAGAAMARVDVRVLDPRRGTAAGHPYLRPLEDAVRLGQAAWRLCRDLRGEGFVPDVVCAHAGFGPGLYVKEAFPDVPLVTYFEWYYRSRGADADFLDGPVHPDDACRIHTANAALLLELAACDAALCPTAFQQAQFPPVLRDRLTVLHDGIDADRIRPAPGTPMVLPGLDLTGAEEIVTYATRGMEAYRGFPQFMRAAADLVERRPGLRIVVGGTDATFYGPRRADGRPWGEAMRAVLAGRDLSRIHFVGPLAPGDWLRLLRATTVHVYLTVPFVLSWSLIEAMAAGCCDTLLGGAGADVLMGGSGDDRMDGGSGDDILTAGKGDDLLAGGDGRDTLDGGKGDDVLSGGNGNDVMLGGDGGDVMHGGGHDDVLLGGNGADVLRGGTGTDWLDGGKGDDFLFGDQGDDRLAGGAGDDVLAGGTGRDAFVFAGGGGQDVVLDFKVGEDVLQIARNVNGTGIASAADVAARVTDAHGSAVIDLGHGDTVTLAGVTAEQVSSNPNAIFVVS